MVFLNIYISGAFIAMLLMALLFEMSSFREYMSDVIDTIQLSGHPYTFFMPLSIMMSIFSWLGVIGVIGMLFDYIEYIKRS